MRRALLLAAALLAGCVTVHPWEREDLARRSMAARGDGGVATRYQHKLLETQTAGGAAGAAPGGGCGCSQ
jgi:uncharacterized protein DUF4266